MDNDIEIYKNKKFSDLCKDIVDNSENNRDQLDILISDLRSLIKSANDALLIVPLIKDYFDVRVRNDEQLVKLAAIVQRIMSGKAGGEAEAGGMILTDEEKDVFKTSMELDQRWIVELAADRQKYIDQSQSLNLFFRPDANIKYVHAMHFMAWKKGVKTLYYCRSEKIGKADKVSKKIEREVIKELDMTQIAQGNDCIACEG